MAAIYCIFWYYLSKLIYFLFFQCLLELLRYTSGVPLLLPRMAKKDAYFEGYLIPKGSQVLLYS